MARWKMIFTVCLLAVLFVGATHAQEEEGEAVPEPLPTLADLSADWLTIPLEGETICSRGTPYQFFARRGNTNNLMIYFQGGGACWDRLTCDVGGTFDATVDDDELLFYDGIFDLSNPDNPLANYSMIFVPYCTADIHAGDAVTDYASNLRIQHNGYRNAATVLDWVYETFPTPTRVFVSGSSAGAYGAIYHAPFILAQYPNADAIVLGDGGAGVTPVGWPVLADEWDIFANMPDFIPALAEADPGTFTVNVLYQATAEAYPQARVAQFTHHNDDVQALYFMYSSLGSSFADWVDGMRSALDELEALPNFTSYIGAGDDHTILALPEFYTLAVDDLTFRDWLIALLNGQQPESVICTDC